MTAIREIDVLIGRASELKGQVESLLKLYDEILLVLDQDKVAIRGRDMGSLETQATKKVRISDEIEERFSTIKEIVLNLHRCSERMPELTPLPPGAALTGVVAWLEGVGENATISGLPKQVLSHVLIGLRSMAGRLVEIHRKSQPALEANRYLLQQLLIIQQENFRFWQEVAQATMSNYNAQGEQKAAGGRSVLQVKA